MLSLKKLCTVEEIDEFSRRYSNLSGLSVDRQYLDKCGVFGVKTGNRKLIGGFAIHVGTPERTLGAVDPDERDEVKSRLPGSDFVECTCVWLSPRHGGRLISGLFWSALAWKVQTSGARSIIFGTVLPQLGSLYTEYEAELIHHRLATHNGGIPLWVFKHPARLLALKVAYCSVHRMMKKRFSGRAKAPDLTLKKRKA